MLRFIKNYMKQNHSTLQKYVEFTSHPKSLDGIDAACTIELTRLDFVNVNTTLSNTIQALENVPSKRYTKANLTKMIEEAVDKGDVVIRKQMSILKAKNYRRSKNICRQSPRRVKP
jgi:hypothetical protein